MATKNINLGTVPVSRGEFNSTTIYYKDNIVQYKRGSYQVISESPIVGIPPINNEDIVNNGWIIFAGTLSEASLIKSNTQDLSGNNVQENLNSAAEKLKELKSEAVYDVSARNNGTTFESLSALLSDENLSTLIPPEIRCGGMSIRFVQSSDNKYVQYRLIADEFTTDVAHWTIADEGIYVENPEFVYLKTDNEGKILWAIKTDGDIYFGAGCPQQVKEYVEQKIAELSLDEYDDIVTFLSDYIGGDTTLKVMIDEINANIDTKLDAGVLDAEALATIQLGEDAKYIQVETDSENKILGGRKSDGTKFENMPFETPTVIVENIDNPEWIDVKTDNKGRLFEGINVNGEKHISKFDSETEGMIKDFVGNSNTVPSIINIPLLDANFTSPAPITITGTKGSENAKYVFELPLKDKANIRFKFKITDNLINNNISAQIANFDSIQVNAEKISLYQYYKDMTINGENKRIYYPTLSGGIRFMENTASYEFDVPFAFSIKYLGEETNVTIQNTGTALILKVGQDTYTYTLSSYNSVYDLYSAIKENVLFEIKYKEIQGHTCDELAIFPECQMINTYYSDDSQHTEYANASAPFFVPYARDLKWHQVEILKIGNTLYKTIDGHTYKTYVYNYGTTLTLGGYCGVLFKDLEISLDSLLDAEISNNIIVSSVSPCLIIYEGHGMFDKPADELEFNPSSPYTPEAMGTSVDRLYYVFRKAIEKGYVPITIEDVIAYYSGEKSLPKRCFTIIFDDFRYNNCLELTNRKVFTELGIHPSLAIVYSSNGTITFDGQDISKKEASEICLRNNFQLLNHLNHVETTVTNPALLLEKLQNDIIQCDKILVDGMTIVYPSGWYNDYVLATLKFLGCKLGISVGGTPVNNPLWVNRYNLKRVDVGTRTNLQKILNNLY